MKTPVILWNGFTLIVTLIVLFLWFAYKSIWSEHDQFGESYSYIDKIGEIKSERVLPRESKNIKYVFRDTGFGYTLGFRCSVDEKSFLDFARDKGMMVTNSVPPGMMCGYFFFDICPMTDQCYFAEDIQGRAEGLKVIYARRASVMIGQYSDR